MRYKIRILLSIMTASMLALTISSVQAEDLSALSKSVARGPQSAQSVYFVMTDRFANGNPANDNGGFSAGDPRGGFDPTDVGYWHGGDFQGLTEHLPYIKKLGFTAIWITPPVKQQFVQEGSAAYHGYWGLDFTTIDPHLGTEADFKNFVLKAHEIGLKVIIDVVANHTADVIKYKVGDTGAYIPAGMFESKNPGWLNDLANYHNKGNIGSPGASEFTGDFFGLDDIFTEKPAVVAGWTKVWSDWITKFNIDGLRIDTFKYIDPAFWKAVLPKVLDVARKAGKPSFPIFGEVADAEPFTTATYVSEHQVPSILDFSFQSSVSNFANGGDASGLADLFNADDAYTTSTTSAYGLATFMGNHDMGRIGMKLVQANGWAGDVILLDRAKLANALLFLLRGGPVLYYGDEKGMTGSGGDKSARQDMFATQVSAWKTELRIGSVPIGDASSFDVHNPLEDQIAQIQSVISTNPALRNGTQQTRFADAQVFVNTRYLAGQEYVTAFNSSDKEETASFMVSTATSSWTNILGNDVVANVQGKKITLSMPARSYVVLKSSSKDAPATKLTVTLKEPAIDYLSPRWISLAATVQGDDYVEVTFSYRIPGKQWISAGTSDHRTFTSGQIKGNLFRTYLHPSDFKNGTKLETIAVVKNAKGELAASKILKFTVNY